MKKYLLLFVILWIVGCAQKLDDGYGNAVYITNTGPSGFTYTVSRHMGAGNSVRDYPVTISWEEAYKKWPEDEALLKRLEEEANSRE